MSLSAAASLGFTDRDKFQRSQCAVGLRRILRILLICCLPGVAGCAGYHLGPSNGQIAGERSVAVPLFRNETREPRVAVTVAQALRRRVQRDGTLRLATHGTADIVLSGVLIAYDRQILSYQPNDVITPRDYVAKMTARVTAKDGGRTLFEREFTGHTTVRLATDPAQAEAQALPMIAEDLARRIAEALVDGAW
ncbi:MAG: hypothetical protein EXS36_06845 [Pedosphaera sp.]|nr:hypothetical protein [Pedosphaera sp.]